MQRPARTRIVLPLLIALATLLSAEARAQPADPKSIAAAQSLYDEALKATKAHDYATACPKLEEVVRLVPEGLGAKLTLAECYEADGRLASAWGIYVQVEQVATQMKQPERQKLAAERSAALKPKLAQLTITVPAALASNPGLRVERDGVVVGTSQWGLEVPVDKGDHEVSVTAPGKKPWKKTVSVKADGDRAKLEVGPLVAEEAQPAVTPPASSAVAPPRAPVPAPQPFWGGQRIAGAVVGGVGIVGLGVGVGFGGLALSRKSASNAGGHCHDGNICDDTGYALRQDARSAGTVSTAMFVAGGVLAAGGAVLFLLAPRASRAEVAIGPQGAFVRGVW